MPDYGLSEEQALFKKSVREFCTKTIAPRAREMDEKGEIPEEVLNGMTKMGLFGLTYSKEYGGTESDFTTAAIVAEELARADISCALAVYYLVQAGWGYIFNKYAKPELKEKVLPPVIEGKSFLGIGSTEPGGGSDVANIKTTAKKTTNGWTINGEKAYLSGVREASTMGGGYMTLVKTAPELKHKGMSFIYIPVNNTPGITVSTVRNMGRTGISTGGFVANNVSVPEENLVGEVNQGFYYAMEGFSGARVLVAAACVGASERAIEMGIDYLRHREAFGKKIGMFQGLQFSLADAYAELEASRLLTYRAAWMVDEMNKSGRFDSHEVAKAVALAKLYAPVRAFSIMNDVMTWHGAYGYSKDCEIEMGVRGVRSYTVGAEGSQNVMRNIIVRELLGREFVAY